MDSAQDVILSFLLSRNFATENMCYPEIHELEILNMEKSSDAPGKYSHAGEYYEHTK